MTSVAESAVAETPATERADQSQVGATRRRRRGSWRGRLTARGLFALSGVLTRLPERPLARVAWAIGGLLYRVQPERRRLVRANLGRVCAYLVERDLGGPRSAAAAHDGHALDRLTRVAFGHYVRSYLEGATLQRYASPEQLARVVPDNAALADEAFPAGRTGPAIVIGLHFGSVEIPALWATARGVPITAPMETVADPDIQSYFERTRGSIGLTLVPLKGAAAKARGALARNETVVLVGDRPLSGSGTLVTLFGAPARLPAGPAVLALETGAPTWVVATRRAGAQFRTRIEPVTMPPTGSAKERITGFVADQVDAFERVIADAPEQWWTLFFQIWDDIPAKTVAQPSEARN